MAELIFISEKAFLDQMKISNGTCLVIDQFYGTGFSQIPKHISFIGAYWYQFWNKTDYALIAYSVYHLLNFVQALDEWLKVFEGHAHNTVLNALITPIKKEIANLDCLTINSNQLKNDPQTVLELGFFFSFRGEMLLSSLIRSLFCSVLFILSFENSEFSVAVFTIASALLIS